MIKSTCKILLFFAALCSVISSCNNYTLSEEQAEKFVRYYPTDSFNYGEGTDLIQTVDGNYMVIGTTSRTEGTPSDQKIMIINTDEFGMETDQSPILIGTTGHEFGYKVIPAEDGGYVIAGSSKQGGNTLGYIIKISSSGEQVWEHTVGTTPLQEFMGITASNDGGFILTGYSKETNGDRQVYLVKTNSGGLTEWERVIGFTGYDDIGEAVVEYGDRIIIAGTTAPVNASSGNSRLLILNTNSEGKGMTECRISEEGNLSGTDMVVDGNENIIILGNQENLISGISSLYFAKIKLEGFNNELITVLNATSVDFPESLHGESMDINTDNSLAVCGWQEKGDDRDILFARFDEDFNLQDDIQLFGSTGYQSGSGICITADGGYAITGGVEVAGNITITLIKLGSDGKLY
jgi:hypothetical protein